MGYEDFDVKNFQGKRIKYTHKDSDGKQIVSYEHMIDTILEHRMGEYAA
jgi:hypothetical protein